MEHKCKELPKYYEIFEVDSKWILSNSVGPTFIKGIKFCPWCGANLEETS